MKEQSIQSKILKFLNVIGYAVKIVSGNKSGQPDIMACINGQFYAFEVKNSNGGKVSPLQDYNIQIIRKNGGKAYVVSSLEEVKEVVFYGGKNEII